LESLKIANRRPGPGLSSFEAVEGGMFDSPEQIEANAQSIVSALRLSNSDY